MDEPPESPRPYTVTLFFLAASVMLYWLVQDMRASGQHVLSAAFGIRSNVWLVVWIFITLYVVARFGSIAAGLFHSFSGQSVVDANDEFVMSGGVDITMWSLHAGLASSVLLFGRAVPPGWFGWLRPALVPFAATLISLVLSTLFTSLLYRVLYPRIPRWR